MKTTKELSAYKRLLEKKSKLAGQIEAARLALAKTCEHPAAFVSPYSTTQGNGYGSTVTCHYNHCSICRKVQPVWGDGPSTQPWLIKTYSSRDDD